MHRFDSMPMHAKMRSWGTHSSGVRTVDSYSDSLTSVGDSGAMSLAELAISDKRMRFDKRATATVLLTETEPTASYPHGLSPHMTEALIRLAKQTGAKVVKEAQASLQTPMQRKNVKLLSFSQGVELYESHRSAPPTSASASVSTPAPLLDRATVHASPLISRSISAPPAYQREPRLSRSRSFWNRLTRKRSPTTTSANHNHSVSQRLPSPSRASSRSEPPMLQHVPRVFGRTQVHVPLDELLEVVGHRSGRASSFVHPGMTRAGFRHTLVDDANEYVCLRTTTLPTPIAASSNPRDFLLVESHHSFTTPTGRRGHAIVCHSVHWPNGPVPTAGAVRGSMYESGLVAIESESDRDRVDLFCVAEVNLKGSAGTAENFDTSHHRVVGTLQRITHTIEERAMMLLSLDHSHVFMRARRTTQHKSKCSGCRVVFGDLLGVQAHTCRKCYDHVCEDCSSMWQRGHKAMRLCMECWADATLNRT